MSHALPAGVRAVRADNPSPMTLDGTRTFLVGERRVAVIDPGPDDPRHRAAIAAALGEAEVVAILLTHRHADHAAGAGGLAAGTGAPIRAAHPDAGDGGAEAGIRATEVDAVHPLRDGDRVETDAGTLAAVSTPGHSRDHLAFVLEPRGPGEGPIVFAGDLLMGTGDTTLVAAPEGDLRQYLRSLERVAALRPALILPAHGPAIEDAPGALARYRRHREERVAQVRSAVASGVPARPGDLLEPVYGAALPPALRGAAEGSLAAILNYLDAAAEI